MYLVCVYVVCLYPRVGLVQFRATGFQLSSFTPRHTLRPWVPGPATFQTRGSAHLQTGSCRRPVLGDLSTQSTLCPLHTTGQLELLVLLPDGQYCPTSHSQGQLAE
jgi:hypothetical protein